VRCAIITKIPLKPNIYEDRVMLLRFGFDQCCEIVGRASAIIAIAGMASLVLAAIAVDVLR